jgi:preprotein translocase subunit SecA
MRIFAGEWVKSVLTRLGMKEGEAIESRMVSRRIEGAQKKVEERNFDIRKNLLETDEVMDEQRKRVYSYRQRMLDGGNCKQLILDMIDQQIEQNLNVFLEKDYGAETFAKWAGNLLSVELEPRDYRGLDFDTAQRQAKEQAERMAESQAFEAVEENLPEGNEEDWNWEALAKFANSRWQSNLRDRDLKKVGRDGDAELLQKCAHEGIEKIDLAEGERFLHPDHGVRTACGWIHYKFGIQINPDEVRDLDPDAFIELVKNRAREAYAIKEAEFPVMAGLVHFTSRDATGQKRYDRDQLVDWARKRFEVDLSVDDLKNKQQDEIRSLLVDHSRSALKQAQESETATLRLVEQVFANSNGHHADGNGTPVTVRAALGESWQENPSVQALVGKIKGYDPQFPAAQIAHLDREEIERRSATVVDDHYRPEMRQLERNLVLQILDAAWKDHLLAMDHLKSSVSLRGYAQLDSKVEFKREGMRTFETMWAGIGDRVTDLIFRMEQLDEGFVGSMWKETAAIHSEAPSTSEIAQQQQSAIGNSQGEQKIEPIRNKGERVGRNDPCPCGSGKKYKNCCMRKQSGNVA